MMRQKIVDKILKALGSRKKITLKEKKSLYFTWKKSKLTIGKFCDIHGLKSSTIARWFREVSADLGQISNQPNKKRSNLFVPLVRTDNRAFSHNEQDFIPTEIQLLNGTKLSVSLSKKEVAHFILELSHAAQPTP